MHSSWDKFEKKANGVVYTPLPVVEFLVNWAIQEKNTSVLDIGTGEGVFLIEAFRKLKKLSVEPQTALKQIFGVEINEETINTLRWRWMAEIGYDFPNVKLGNIFDVELPQVDAIIGNPPYVTRNRLQDIDYIRDRVFPEEEMPKDIGRLTDLYAYFLVYATKYLKKGGRLAVVISSSWLDANFGIGLKRFLKQNFAIRAIYGFEGKLFQDALIKPVLLLAEKINYNDFEDTLISFIRIKEKFSQKIADTAYSKNTDESKNQPFVKTIVNQSKLDPKFPWGIYLKTPDVYLSLLENSLLTKFRDVAYTRIGLQTLAKNFYILDRERIETLRLEPEFWQPLAFSPREFSSAVIDDKTSINRYLFYCDQLEDMLINTNAKKHIDWGKAQIVYVRGKKQTVEGYHNQKRIQQARRNPWYNIKSEVNRRGRLPIIIPRRIFKNYLVLWNKCKVIPNEDFIETKPHIENDLFPLLAVLNSSFTELMLRMHAQVYGGGVYNINPGQLKDVPIINLSLLSKIQKDELSEAYSVFIDNKDQDRNGIDHVVFDILGLEEQEQWDLLAALDKLKEIATSSKNTY